MLALVTGGSGYLGEILAKRLLARGDRVRVVDIADNEDRPAEVELVRGDVRDPSIAARATRGADVVYHAVAQVPLAKSRHEFWSVNVGGTEAVVRSAIAAGARKVVVVSSSAIYGVPRANPVDLRTEPVPAEDYGRAKLEGERAAQRIAKGAIDLAIVRPRTVLGHGRLGIFQILFEWIRRGRPVYLLGRGDNVYQFVHVDDLVAVCIAAGDRPGTGTYLAGTDRYGTMREIVEGLVAHAGTGSPVRSLPFGVTQAAMKISGRLGLSPLGDYHALMYGRSLWFDVSETQRDLGWSPRYSNVEAIRESYDYYLANRERILSRTDASHHRSAVKLGILKLVDLLP